MTRFRLHRPATSPMSIADLVPKRAKRVYDRLAVSEDYLEQLFLMLMRRKVQCLGCKRPQLRQVGVAGIFDTDFLKHMLARAFEQRPRSRDCALWIQCAAVESLLPCSVYRFWIERLQRF